MNIRRITEIWIYPIKSLAGIRLEKSNVNPKGLQYDRRWMLVDNEGRFLTQREHPEMALFKSSIDTEHITIHKVQSKIEGLSPSIRINLNGEVSGSVAKVQIWDDVVEAAEVDSNHSAWFSKHLSISCKLVFFKEDSLRNIDSNFAKNKEQVSLADGYPFLIVGQSSLDELNRRLEKPISMKRFRPNFVFSDGTPHEEDAWRNIKVGSVNFEGVKPCSRCVLITVDPATGEKGVEPLKTLSSYRRENGKVYFGENLIARTNGEVREGDVIEIIDYQNT